MNRHAIAAIYKFEMARWGRTLWQSLITPVITTVLYFVVFGSAIGSRMTAMEGGWIEYDLGAVTIGVGCHPAWQPSRDGTTVAFEVDDFDATVAKLKERGVTFDMDKTETPVCWMAQFRDPDGNKLLVHKRKPK